MGLGKQAMDNRKRRAKDLFSKGWKISDICADLQVTRRSIENYLSEEKNNERHAGHLDGSDENPFFTGVRKRPDLK